MDHEKKVLVFPGTIQYARNYGGYDGLDIWMNRYTKKDVPSDTEFFIGHSLGASYILNLERHPGKKYIFVNPLMKKRRIPNLFVRWIKFHLFEGISKEKVVPMRHWIHTLRQVFFLLKTDVLKEMCKIPRTDMTVIRGSQDRFFCDDKDVELLVGNGFDVIEVDAGHDWNKNVADTAEKIMSR